MERGSYVVVGVDGSVGAERALRVAQREAQVRAARLVVVRATPPLFRVVPARGEDPRPHDEVVAALGAAAAADVEEVAADADPVRLLVEVATGAELLVVGSRGAGPLRAALLGSVSSALLSRTPCPLEVVHGLPPDGPARVVVGVDGSPASLHALRWADALARARRLPLAAVHAGPAWASPYVPGPEPLAGEAAGELLDRWLVRTLGAGRAAQVARTTAHRSPAALLLQAVSEDDLLVLGRSGRGLLATSSVLRRVTARVPGAVVVVPGLVPAPLPARHARGAVAAEGAP